MLGRNKHQLKNVRHMFSTKLSGFNLTSCLSLTKRDEATYKFEKIICGMVGSAFSSSLLELNCPQGGGLTWGSTATTNGKICLILISFAAFTTLY